MCSYTAGIATPKTRDSLGLTGFPNNSLPALWLKTISVPKKLIENKIFSFTIKSKSQTWRHDGAIAGSNPANTGKLELKDFLQSTRRSFFSLYTEPNAPFRGFIRRDLGVLLLGVLG